jgi:hypothetical protein
MTENLSRLSVSEHDKHAPVRGQPFNPVNPPPIALKRPIDSQVVSRELGSNIAQHDFKRKQTRRFLPFTAERTPAAPAAAVVSNFDNSIIAQAHASQRTSQGREGQGCRDDGNQKGAHDAKHARIDRYRSLNPG